MDENPVPQKRNSKKQGRLPAIPEVSIETALAKIKSDFSNRADCLHYYFSSKFPDNKKFCHQIITSLPNFDLYYHQASLGVTIEFVAQWNANIIPAQKNDWGNDGWGAVPGKKMATPFPISTYGRMLMPSAHTIIVYNWGFEIFSHSGLEMTGACPYVLDHLSLAHTSLINNEKINTDWSLSVLPETNMTPIMKWSLCDDKKARKINDEIDEIFDQNIDKSVIMDVGQRNVEIDID